MTDTVTYQDPNKPPYTPKAFYSTYLGNWGVALRTAEGRVFFRYEDLGLWTERLSGNKAFIRPIPSPFRRG
jgi:hypothetical protein